jgi:hypothetical protein
MPTDNRRDSMRDPNPSASGELVLPASTPFEVRVDQLLERDPAGRVIGCEPAACEAHVGKDTWRRDGTTGWHAPYLGFLAEHGYTLAEVEDYAASDQTV